MVLRRLESGGTQVRRRLIRWQGRRAYCVAVQRLLAASDICDALMGSFPSADYIGGGLEASAGFS